MTYDFDVIVLGSGAGGAAFAHACAVAGHSVLVIERGKRPLPDRSGHDERATLIDKSPYDDRTIQVNQLPLRLYMGGVLGGSTAVYGGAMLRPSRDDFQPGRHYSDRLPRELWDWPVTYDELRPFYDEAERLYALAGGVDEPMAPLEPPARFLTTDVIPLAPINERLMRANRLGGLFPFRLPLAIDTSRCQRCSHCAGFLCPYDARRSSAHLLDETASEHALQVMTGAEVERLLVEVDRSIGGVVVRQRDRGTSEQLRARCYALACGAIGSPAIALKSGLDSPHLGRNFMMHYSPIAAGIFARSTGADETFVKQVGFADFYFGTPDLPRKMGIVQSLPAPGPLMLAKAGLGKVPASVRRFLRRRMLPLAGIVEDLPDPDNRITLADDGTIRLQHRFTPFDQQRGAALGRQMVKLLKRGGAIACSCRPFPSHEHVAHQCGTMRLGSSSRHAVVDKDCRMFGSPNLLVVDGSVLPTSLGVGPSLTIVANALRVAAVVLDNW